MENDVNRLTLYNTSGPLKQIIDVLAGKNGKLWLKGINTYLRQGAIKAFGWKILGPFKLRVFESADVLMSTLKYKEGQKEIFMACEIPEMIEQIAFPIKEETVKFVALTPEELGFEDSATVSQIVECLPSLGLEMCKDSDAIQLLLLNMETLSDEVVTNFPGTKKFLKNLPNPNAYFVVPLYFPGNIFKIKSQQLHKDAPTMLQMYYHKDSESIGFVGQRAHERYTKNNEHYFEEFSFCPNEKLLFRVTNQQNNQ